MNSHSAGTSPDPSTLPQRSSSEEFYNAATHFFGLGLSVAGGVALLATALIGASRPLFLACLIYIASLMAVFLFSALSHSFTDLGRQTFYRKMDQSFIYLLIAASWTPFSVAFLETPWWNGFLLLMWLIALTGFLSKLFLGHRVNRVSVWLYLALGWTPVLGGMLTTPLLPRVVLAGILTGGAFYTLGTLCLFNDQRHRWLHPTWHLFVIGGSTAHYLTILWYVF